MQFFVKAVGTASLGGLLYGYDMGVIAGALPPLSRYFGLNASQAEWVVSLLYFGGGAGALAGGFLCDWKGRKTTILLCDVMFLLGAICLASARHIAAVFAGRFVVGFAVAVSGIADVAYLHEISSVWDKDEIQSHGASSSTMQSSTNLSNEVILAQVEEGEEEESHSGGGSRGSVVSVNEAAISLGFLLAYGVAFAFDDADQSSDEAWRLLFGVGGVIAILQFGGMIFMPESPIWLEENGRMYEAEIAKDRIRGKRRSQRRSAAETSTTHAQSQQEDSQAVDPIEQHSSPSTRAKDYCLRLFLKTRSLPSWLGKMCRSLRQDFIAPYKKQCLVSFWLATFQQFCGHPSVLVGLQLVTSCFWLKTHWKRQNYSEELFRLLDGGVGSTTELVVGIGVLKFVATCIVIFFIEKTGRKVWLLSGTTCILISLSLLCIAFAGRPDKHIGGDTEKHSTLLQSEFGIAGIYGVAIGYACSFGPLTWLITSEVFCPSLRGRALGFATVVTYLAAGLVSRTFLSLKESIGLSATLSLYWVATFLSLCFSRFGIPETVEKSPDEIETRVRPAVCDLVRARLVPLTLNSDV
ncbi:hypothetical protein THAOC_03770 [Thalassiosira oceanica]|uniref:Hexose transporter 1 n=1 Tax=Thalassiosira oceanica TaxID=159749 RepID=K0TPK4_THAOC|nr:hypothetical protein THAOC_03770 [Thalassiosira oceanica]|eukprot:EJK74547.1 hypothetical protein THAOC_03770 [Thalassiosira oceanica]